MHDGRLERFERAVHESAHVRNLPTGPVGDVQRKVIACRLEHRQGLVDQLYESRGGPFGLHVDTNFTLLDSTAQFANAVVCGL